MIEIYRIGLIIGIVVIYSLVTLGVGLFINFALDDEEAFGFFMAWVIGTAMFVILACLYLKELGLWDGITAK